MAYGCAYVYEVFSERRVTSGGSIFSVLAQHSFTHRSWNVCVLEREKRTIVAQLEQPKTLYINGSNAKLLLSASRTFVLYSCGVLNIVRCFPVIFFFPQLQFSVVHTSFI